MADPKARAQYADRMYKRRIVMADSQRWRIQMCRKSTDYIEPQFNS